MPHNSTVNSVWNIVKNAQKWLFSKFPENTVTLTKGQGHQRSYHFKGSFAGYLSAKSHNSTVNRIWDIVKNCKMEIFRFLSKDFDLDPMSHPFEGLSTGYLWAKFHNPFVKVTQCDIILKVSSHAICLPSFITLLPINSVWNIVKFVKNGSDIF